MYTNITSTLIISAGTGLVITLFVELIVFFVKQKYKDNVWRKRFVHKDKRKVADEVFKILAMEGLLFKYEEIGSVINKLRSYGEKELAETLVLYWINKTMLEEDAVSDDYKSKVSVEVGELKGKLMEDLNLLS